MHYDKLYFGEGSAQTMLRYQVKKRALMAIRQNSQKLGKEKQRFYVTNNKSALSDSDEKILQDSQLKYKFVFHPVEAIEHGERSKFELSLCEIDKLKRNLSTMIGELKLNDSLYPQLSNMQKPFIQFNKSKEELKFRKKLESNFSDIHEPQMRQLIKQNTKSNNNNLRLFTSPDPVDNSYLENKYAEAYGFLLK